MLNQVILVGRLVEDPVVFETETGKSVSTVTLAVNRSFKNSNGEYDTDFIKCTLWQGLAESTCEYCQKGSTVGVKGRIASRNITIDHMQNEEKTKIDPPMVFRTIEVIAEKITFISTKKD
jgi:single-strand DNA-binding protein